MGKKLTTEEWVQRATQKHKGKYDYSLVKYINSRTEVKIICPIHGVFEQRAENHMYGQGCPNCITPVYISNQEIELQEWLSQYIDIETNDKFIK